MDVTLLYRDLKSNRQLEFNASALRLAGGLLLERFSPFQDWEPVCERDSSGDETWVQSPMLGIRWRLERVFLEVEEPLLVRAEQGGGTFLEWQAAEAVELVVFGGRLGVHLDDAVEPVLKHDPAGDLFRSSAGRPAFDRVVFAPAAFFASQPAFAIDVVLPGDRSRLSPLAR